MRTLGVDPGSSSFDLCMIEDLEARISYESSIPTSQVARNPESLLKAVEQAQPEIMVGPSAMGLPVTQVSQVDDWSLVQMTLGKNTEVDIAIRRFIQMLQNKEYNAYFVPGVIQLPTVPRHRKRNKVDMGTADKTAITALALSELATATGYAYNECSFLVAELGFGFNALMTVKNGVIVDGLGGTTFPGPGYLCSGALDLELAHNLPELNETHLGVGGISYDSGEVVEPERFASRLDEKELQCSWQSLEEGLRRAVAMEIDLLGTRPQAIFLSGRLAREERLFERLASCLESFDVPLRRLQGLGGSAKAAAQGAALIASGLGGGAYAELVQCLKLWEARGSVLDYVCWPEFNPQEVLARKLQNMRR